MPKNFPRHERAPRILLSSVVGPYGVDDAFGRKENIMELLHNQVTRGQGLASWRFHHRSFGLYLMAANLAADVTVLDFPNMRRFMRELRQGYDIIGISFITPNFLKAQEMARVVRRLAPEAVLVFGGHGAAIEGIDKLLDCDHVVKGEGIRWFRQFLGQDVQAPIAHPAMPNIERMSVYGIPFPRKGANLLITGVGCVNGCRFCSTSHFFGRAYTSFVSSGDELFDLCCKIADQTGVDEFFIMDENFLKTRDRAEGLLAAMERHRRFFTFQIFSSAEAVLGFGLDKLLRLGVDFLWIGVEASTAEGNYEKNKGVDARALVREMRDRGIRVLASGILGMEHHTPDNIQQDIDFMIGLEADMVQFMLLTSLPTTALYLRNQERGLLRTDLPYEEWHGQKHLNYHHPAFPGDSAAQWLNAAFRQEYEVNSSSMYRVIDTVFRGWQRLAALPVLDDCLAYRKQVLRNSVLEYRVILPLVAQYAVNDAERQRAKALEVALNQTFGPVSPKERLLQHLLPWLTRFWQLRVRCVGDVIQPKTMVTHYPAQPRGLATVTNPAACPLAKAPSPG